MKTFTYGEYYKEDAKMGAHIGQQDIACIPVFRAWTVEDAEKIVKVFQDRYNDHCIPVHFDFSYTPMVTSLFKVTVMKLLGDEEGYRFINLPSL